jgi:uncharacterized protein
MGVTLTDRIKDDLSTAMKAGERDRVAALRLVLSELQKAAKEGDGDEQAVLRRERKRRLDAAEAYRDAAREDLAEGEELEAAMIEGYLPAQLGEDELRALVEDAVRQAGAAEPRDMGRVMKLVMPVVGGRADGKRVSAKVREVLGA